MKFTTHSRGLLIAGSLLLTLGVGIMRPGAVHAQVSICRTDPIVTLSNGDRIALSTTIGDGAADVEKVTYSLDGPVGTTVVAVRYFPDSVSKREHFAYHADLSWTGYIASTRVTTGRPADVTDTVVRNNGTPRFVLGDSSQTLTVVLPVRQITRF